MSDRNIEVKWTPFAFLRLHEIFDYILFNEKSIDLAQQIVDRIFDRTDQLKEFPESGSPEPLLKEIGQDSRFLLEAGHKIIYEYHPVMKIVIVTDVFHTSRDPSIITK
ncbi:MAG: type II toxin-antitoxin system RelE/ParE family toxin [Cyclobacteriaceae bacterium]|nr:type II toxin-antitoxin system RelE/ParE family toxin [Cyclobacteriaceae bacterium]